MFHSGRGISGLGLCSVLTVCLSIAELVCGASRRGSTATRGLLRVSCIWVGVFSHPSALSTGARQPRALHSGLHMFMLGLHLPYTLNGIMVSLELRPKLSLVGLGSSPILTVG